jgi:hypothetical protein
LERGGLASDTRHHLVGPIGVRQWIQRAKPQNLVVNDPVSVKAVAARIS